MNSEPENNLHFSVDDFKGNLITCEEDRWQDHIVGSGRNRLERHNELDGQEDLVIRALQKPAAGIRYHSSQPEYPNRMIYYGAGIVTQYVRVVVEFADTHCRGNGKIITVLSVDKIKSGEKAELPTP